jgi:anti-anti-sigma factor
VRTNALTLTTDVSEAVAIVRGAGDLDLSTLQVFEAELGPCFSSALLVVELAECTFIDSSALRAIVQAQQQMTAAGGRLVLVAPSQPARRVLDVSTLDRLIPVSATLAEALTSVA